MSLYGIKKFVSFSLFVMIVASGLVPVLVLDSVLAQAPGVIIIVSSDTTWTKEDSPFLFTGPVFVKENAILTIEAGVTVDLNGYYLLVNGTLRVMGNSSEQVEIGNGDRIEFAESSQSWNDSGFGCVIEHAVIETKLTLKTASPKIYNCTLYSIEIEGKSSPLILNNTIRSSIFFGSNNIVMGSPSISNNNITWGIGSNLDMYGISYDVYLVEAGSPLISHNQINGKHPSGGIHVAANSLIISNNNLVDSDIYVAGNSSTITNNIVNGSVEIVGCRGKAVISNNTITPPSRVIDSGVWIVPNYTEWYFGIFLEGHNKFVDVVISNNTISGCSSGIKVGNIVGSVAIEGNDIHNNVEDGINVVADINLTVVGNFIIRNAKNGIKDYWGKANMQIINNTITSNNCGISDPGPSSLIERNLIDENNVGLELSSQVSIQNNTITNSKVAIRLNYCPSTINYNNIENYTDNSIFLSNNPNNIDATNNCWGTTDIQAINLTIHDYKYDLELGKVTLIPFLNDPNPEDAFTPIPEFPSWIILPLILTLTLTVSFYRKNFPKHYNHIRSPNRGTLLKTAFREKQRDKKLVSRLLWRSSRLSVHIFLCN